MSLIFGTRLGPYEIIAPIGAGGMGEVYRAKDTNLDRDVAIKVLPESFAMDADRVARFAREAKTLAALNHPNIAAIYGLEKAPDLTALVMELVEGEDLSAHIARGAIPLADALLIAKQIADALEAAHEQGIVHRDLKPANIKVRADGTVKVLDFGLAKAMDPAGSASGEAMNSPTMTARNTQMGMIIGTAAYMSPEQARGKPVDKRADIWAFGVVMFEMLSGRRLFAGDEITDVLARVLERDPDWTLLAATSPPALRHLLERCLTKDPKARLRDIGDARHTLNELIAGRPGSVTISANAIPGVGAPARTATSRIRSLAPWLVAAAFATLAGIQWARQISAPALDARPLRVELGLPEGVEFYTSPRISRDRRRVMFIGNREGIRQAYVRDLDQADARPLPGTEGSVQAAFSPDGKWAVVVTAEARLRRVSLETGGAEDLAGTTVDIVGGLSVTESGRILLGQVTKLAWVALTGGPVTQIVAIDKAGGEASLAGPIATPDGQTVLFTSWTGSVGARPRIEAVSINGGGRRVLIEDASYVVAISADRLVFQRGSSVYAVPFDPVRAEVTGTAAKLTDEVGISPTSGLAADITSTGDLLFADTRTSTGRLSWVSLDGVDRPINAPVRAYNNPRVSPDGRMVAFSDGLSIWTTDTARGSQSKISTGTDALTGFPVWSLNGEYLFFRSASGVLRIRADGEGKAELVRGTLRQDYPNAMSPDGTSLLMTRITADTSGDVMLIPLAGGEAVPVVATPAYEGGAQFSPDGKWVTYVSNSSGRMEVYIRPTNGTQRTPVSTSGGLGALWSRDGKRIFFRTGQKFMVVDVTTSPSVQLSAPRLLFERRYAFGPNLTIANYSLDRDGKEFLLVSASPAHLSLIFNWLQTAGR